MTTAPAAQTRAARRIPAMSGTVAERPAATLRLDPATLVALTAGWDAGRAFDIGFPAATDLDCTVLLPVLGRLLNNIGDPYSGPGPYPMHTLDLERQVVEHVADLLRATPGSRRGYVTSGSTEGTLAALRAARQVLPDAVVVASSAAHYSVPKAADLLALPTCPVRADASGQLDYTDFAAVIRAHQWDRGDDAPVIVVATAGTTMTEAVDDIRVLTRILDAAGVPAHQRWIHVDAALAGLPLALLDPATRPGFDIADGAHSIVLSGHKFLGTPFPCGVLVIAPGPHLDRAAARVSYIGGRDATISGSRTGHTTLMLAYALTQWTTQDLRARAERARELAAYTTHRLVEAGVPAWRHPHAFTVAFPAPSPAVLQRWRLPVDGDLTHIICMPGRTHDQIDRFVRDVNLRRRGPARRRRRRHAIFATTPNVTP